MQDPEALLSIWTRISKGRSVDIRLATGLHVPKRYWDGKKERPRNYTGNNPDLANSLTVLDDKLTSLRIKLYEGAIMHETFTKEMAKRIIDSVVSRDMVKSDDTPRDIDKYCRMVIDQMVSGIRTIGSDGRSTTKGKGKAYSKGTIKSWSVFLGVLEAYAKDHPMSWEMMTESWLIGFKDFMTDHGYMNATQNKFIGTFKALSAMAQDDKLHTMTDIYRSLSKEDEKSSDTKTTKIYLTDAEIQALYEMPLAPGSLKDQVRDIFCVGCYTGQRISDYNHLSPEMFTKSAYGHDVIKIKQKKTGHEITIPVLNANLLEIAKKYDYNLPTVNDVVLNRYIKEICKELSASVPSLNDKVTTTLTLRDERLDSKSIAENHGPIFSRDIHGRAVRPRYELVCSHTARRSCITNLYLSDILSDQDIMHISGHEDYKSYKKYLCMSGDKIAERIAQKVAESQK